MAETGAQRLAQTLRDSGVEAVFGLIGGGNFLFATHVVDAGARFVAARHEAGALAMADGWARVTGRVGVATVTQGPGLTNALTALVEAVKAGTPLLVVAGDTKAGAEDNQDVDQDALARWAGAAAIRVRSPGTVASDAADALALAERVRRPVLLSVPVDVGATQLAGAQTVPLSPASPPRHAPAPADRVAAAAELLASAARPLVLAGRGAVIAGARNALVELADRLGAPLATTAQAHGLFTGHPRALGIAGGFTAPESLRVLQSADVVLAAGASLTRWTTRNGQLFESARVVRVDIADSAELSGDARATAEALAAQLPAAGPRPPWAPLHASALPTDESGADGADPRAVIAVLDACLPPRRLAVVDSGHHMGWPAMHLRVPDARAWVFAQDFQAVGLGLAGAIGAAIGRPDHLTVAFVGDGGLLMSLGELDAAVAAKVPLLVVVLDDDAYGAELHHFAHEGVPTDLATFAPRDLAGVARALGARAERVRTPEGVPTALAGWLKRPAGVFVLQVAVTRRVRAGWLEEAFAGPR
jgi:thiamine pyrophosphate-dependent acetolactate synthase large subunit-like protein